MIGIPRSFSLSAPARRLGLQILLRGSLYDGQVGRNGISRPFGTLPDADDCIPAINRWAKVRSCLSALWLELGWAFGYDDGKHRVAEASHLQNTDLRSKVMRVRVEEEKDRDDVHALNVSVFETPSEANLVDALREQARPVISLVAEEHETVVGHIMFRRLLCRGIPI